MKIKLEDLIVNSTPCEICVAMNGRAILKKDKRGNYFNENYCTKQFNLNERYSSVGGSGCTDADKAQIKLLYLNLRK